MKCSVFTMTQTYKSIGDKMQGNQGGKMWEKKMKKFLPFPSMEVVEAEVSKKPEETGVGGKRQRLHKISNFHNC